MTEIEAKFLLRQSEQVDEVLRVLHEHGYEVSDDGTSDHVDRYFDTADWSIRRAGWACRSRQREGESKLVLKSLAPSSGTVFERDEIEQPLPAAAAAPGGGLPSGPVQERLGTILHGARSRELFRVETRRTVYEIDTPSPQPARLELDLDHTRIRTKKVRNKAPGQVDFIELEVELESGDPADVESLGQLLREELGLVPSQYSKFERGMQAAGLRVSECRDWPHPHENDPVLALVFGFLRRELQLVDGQRPRAVEGIDPEGVHQMRVAIRRIRAVIRAFNDIVGREQTSRLDTDLRWLTQELGYARDADICLLAVRRREDTPIPAFERYLQQRSIDAHSRLVTAFEGERYAVLIDELSSLINKGPSEAISATYGDLTIAEAADGIIATAAREILDAGDRMTSASPARQLHRLRIRAKRFRYLLDLFSLARKKRWNAVIGATKKLQKVLGEHQDAVTEERMLREFANSLPIAESSRETLLAVGGLIRQQQQRMASCRRTFDAVWPKFAATVTRPGT